MLRWINAWATPALSVGSVDEDDIMMVTRILFAGVLLLAGWRAGGAAEINVEQGRRLARELCAGCHSVEKSGASPLAIAPPFRVLEQRLPVSRLGEAFREGLVGAHPSMPRFRFDADQIENLVAYIKSLN